MPRPKRACRRRFKVMLFFEILFGLLLLAILLFSAWVEIYHPEWFPTVLLIQPYWAMGVSIFVIFGMILFIQRLTCVVRP